MEEPSTDGVIESSANIASAIMLRIPTHRLPRLRARFEASNGLDLAQFLQTFVQNMDLPDEKSLLRMIPDLVDFFNQVDINGDGTMEWSEFVMFVIEQVVQESSRDVNEKLDLVAHQLIQPPSNRQTVQSSCVFPGINRVFVGANEEIQVYEAVEESSAWLQCNVGIPLTKIGSHSSKGSGASNVVESSSGDGKSNDSSSGKSKGSKNKGGNHGGQAAEETAPIVVLDMAFLPTRDIMVILRSDLCLEFFRFSSRAKFSPETVFSLGIEKLTSPLTKIAVRDIPKEPIKLLALGSTSAIETWTMEIASSGHIELSDKLALKKHSDYVRDILVIHHEIHKYIVSAGMDGKVFLWDLSTLKYKAARTGHTAGVQCLAFDGRSLLLAGGFDTTIIGWDLDAEIDRPIFRLVGHSATVVKIVGVHLGPQTGDRCLSLDTSGGLRYWDTSKTNPNDGEMRLVAPEVSLVEDRVKTFEIIRVISGAGMSSKTDKNSKSSSSSNGRGGNNGNNKGHHQPSLHGLCISTYGRRQHVYRVADLSPRPTSPIAVLVSGTLLMAITVHVKEVRFWDLVTGDFQSSLSMDRPPLGDKGANGGSTPSTASSGEILCACLDDRRRKLILGDSLGRIRVLNCLNGVRLKDFPKLPYAVRYLVYTPDKTVIAIAGIADIFIFDENSAECDSRIILREAAWGAHSSNNSNGDIIAVAYSHALNLIATADATGSIFIWNYEFLSLEAVIRDFTGGSSSGGASGAAGPELGQLSFLDPFPLLLVTDKLNNFHVVPVTVGEIRSEDRNLVYRLESVLPDLRPQMVAYTPSLLDMIKSGSESISSNNVNESNSTANGNDDLVSNDEHSKKPDSAVPQSNQRSSAKPPILISSSSGTANPEFHGLEFPDSDDLANANGNQEESSQLKPLNRRHTQQFLMKPRECRSIQVRVSGLYETKSQQENEEDLIDRIRYMVKLQDPQEDELYRSLAEEEENLNNGNANTESSKCRDPREEDFRALGSLPTSFRLEVLCGYDDGFLATYDLTDFIVEIGSFPLTPSEMAPTRIGGKYNARRTCRKRPRMSELEGVIWNNQAINDREVFSHAKIRAVWRAHSGTVNCIQMIESTYQDDNNSGPSNSNSSNNINVPREVLYSLTSSEDLSIKLWELNSCMLSSTLTRGPDLDKIIKPKWKTPLKMINREKIRMGEARVFMRECNLKRVKMKYPKEAMVFGRATEEDNDDNENGANDSMLSSISSAMVSTTAGLGNTDTLHHKINALSNLGNSHQHDNQHHRLNSQTNYNHGDQSQKTMSMSLESQVHELSLSSKLSAKSFVNVHEPERSRVIGQLRGAITYIMSNKDLAKLELSVKHSGGLHIGGESKRSDSSRSGHGGKKKVVKSMEAKYLDDLMADTDTGLKSPLELSMSASKVSTTFMTKSDGNNASNKRLEQLQKTNELVNPTKERNIKTKYDLDLAKIDAEDPNNWEIHSMNRQRSLYQRLYSELDLAGITKDSSAMLRERLNALSPNHDFEAFAQLLRRERKTAKGMLTQRDEGKQSEESIQHIVSDTPIPHAPFIGEEGIVEAEPAIENFGTSNETTNDFANSLNSINDTPTMERKEEIDLTLDLSCLIVQSDNGKERLSETKPAVRPFIVSKSLRSPNVYSTATAAATEIEELPVIAQVLSPIKARAMSAGQQAQSTSALPLIGSSSQSLLQYHPRTASEVHEKVLAANHSYSKLLPMPKHLVDIEDQSVADERLRRAQSIQDFEASLKATEKTFRASNRQRRRDRAKVKRLHKTIDVAKNPSLNDQMQELMPRHRAVKLTFESKDSLEDMIEIGMVQKSIEKNLDKKIMFTNKSYENLSFETRLKMKEEKLEKLRSGSRGKSEGAVPSRAVNPASTDRKILAKSSFGPYNAAELLKLYQIFLTMPKKTVVTMVKRTGKDNSDHKPSNSEGLAAKSNDNNVEPTESGRNDDGETNNAHDDEDDNGHDEVIESHPTGKNDIEYLERREIDTVGVQQLCENPFFKMRPQYKGNLYKFIDKRVNPSLGVLRHHVYASIDELILNMCPFMSLNDRKECLRYFELKTKPEDTDNGQDDSDRISMDNLERLRILFNFFDLDKSGGVDIKEITTGLKRAAKAGKGGGGLEIDEAAIRNMISSVDNDENCELDFEEFVHLFKNVL